MKRRLIAFFMVIGILIECVPFFMASAESETTTEQIQSINFSGICNGAYAADYEEKTFYINDQQRVILHDYISNTFTDVDIVASSLAVMDDYLITAENLGSKSVLCVYSLPTFLKKQSTQIENSIDMFCIRNNVIYYISNGSIFSKIICDETPSKLLSENIGAKFIYFYDDLHIAYIVDVPTQIKNQEEADATCEDSTFLYSLLDGTTVGIYAFEQLGELQSDKKSGANRSSSNYSTVVGNTVLPLPEYPVGSYATTDGSACSGHNKCLRYYTDPSGNKVDTRGWQCCGFARYVFYRCFGFVDWSGCGSFYEAVSNVGTGSITVNYLKNIFGSKVLPGAHIRTNTGTNGYAHSLVYLGCDDTYVYTYECNTDGHCGVSNVKRTWPEMVSYLTKTKYGIAYIDMPSNYPSIVLPTKPTLYTDKTIYNEGTSIIIKWDTVTNNSYYWINIYKDGNLIVDQSMGNSTSYTLSSASAGNYTVYVSANNSAGTSGSSSCSFQVISRTTKITSWFSEGKMGDSEWFVKIGTPVYFCYKIYDENTNDLYDTYHSGDYTVKEEVFAPDGSTVFSHTYTNDNNWIMFTPSENGVYTGKATYFNGTSTTTVTSTIKSTRDLYETTWLSKTALGTEIDTFYIGETYYFNYKLYDPESGELFNSYNILLNSYPVTLKITDPNGNVSTKNFDTKDTGYIAFKTSVGGTYKAEFFFNGSSNAHGTTFSTSYTVTYNANGGIGAPSEQEKLHDNDLMLSSVRPTGKTYTVTFDGNGGSVAEDSKQYKQVFSNWNTKEDGSGDSYAAGYIYSANSDTTLYAQYRQPSLNNVKNPSQNGYYFAGWYDSTEKDGDGLPVGKRYFSTTEIPHDITLYAMWSKSANFLWGDYNLDGVIENIDMLAIARHASSLEEFTDEELFRCDVNADGVINEEDTQLIASVIVGNISQSDLPVYKYFKGISIGQYPQTSFAYGSEINTEGLELIASYTNGTAYVITDNYIISGYDPFTIGKQTIMVNYYQFSTTYTITVLPPEYILYFDATGGAVSQSWKTVTYDSTIGALPSPTRAGYTFLGWSYNQVSASYISATTKYSYMENKTVYAQWAEGCAENAHSYSATVVSPTCTAQGYTVHTCIYCGNSYKDTYTAELGHSYSYKVTNTPTTVAAGMLTGTCSQCSGTTMIALPKLSTTDYYYSVVKAATCTTTGTGCYTWMTTVYGSFSFDEIINKTSHDYTSPITPPTCTELGYTTHTCIECGDSYKDTYTAALGHSYSYKVTTAPTASATGVFTGTCSRCSGTTTVTLPKLNTTDYSYSVVKAATCTATGTGRYTWKTTTYGSFYFDVTIAKTAHNYTATVTAPTCTAQGYTTHTCTGCGGSYKDTYTAALGHNYSYKVTTVPTASATGVLTGTCSRCSGSTTVTLPKLNTTDYSYSVVKAATCTATGTGRYTWKTTTYGSFYFDVTIAKTAHNYTATVTAPTCTAQGYTTHTCSACGDSYKDTYTSALGHSESAWIFDRNATCTASGSKHTECTRCGVVIQTGMIAANGHTAGAWIIDKNATCTASGTKHTECTVCGATLETATIPAAGHSYTASVTAPSCTEKGFTTHTCTVCGDSYQDTYTTELGHAWDGGRVTTQPMETTEGVKTFTCTRCGETKTESIPVLGHTHEYTTKVTAPTCTEKGYTTHTCACGDSYVDRYVDALGHAWDGGKVTTRPTATESGVKTFSCTRCNATRTESIPATGEQNDKPCDGGADCVSKKFVDVNPKEWYHPYVDYAVTHGLFGGTSENTFEPETAMTRAMLVTVLWRYEGKPMGYQNSFTDVPNKEWYTDAVAWAAANGVVNGVGNGRFDPEGKITREQMAAILFRYAEKKGIDTSKRGDLGGFPDANQVSGYAKDAVQWAVGEGIINGSDGKLLPQGSATRAQVATILMRYIENIVKR